MDQNLVSAFINSKWFNPDYLFNQSIILFNQLVDYIRNYNGAEVVFIYDIVSVVIFFLTIFFLIIISYSLIRTFEIRKKERNHLKEKIAEYVAYQAEQERKLQEREEVSKNPRWLKTLGYLFSQHPSDWRLAIIEADLMLEELMSQMGFKGESLGDKLKSATQDKFRGLTNAWEVHTIRNRIAHEGANFILSQHEAKRAIALYEQIFREFGFI